jgi:hypothetical protein
VSEKHIVKAKMNNEEAKAILSLYRPDTADGEDPSFAEALELCKRDSDLKLWFEAHCALYTALRSKFRQIPVPEGFKEQIIAERKVHTTPVWQKAVVYAGAVAAAFVIVFEAVSLWPRYESHDFAAYENHVISYATRSYGMDFNSTDLDQIRSFIAQRQGIADYELPAGLQKNAKAAGCVAQTWQGKQFSMICFKTGRPLKNNEQSDLWLFVSDSSSATGTPASSTPHIEKMNGVTTASWTSGNRTYVLATTGDEQLLGKYL